MKTLLLLSALLLTSCARDIAGLTRDERLTLYGTAVVVAGHPQYAPLIHALRTSAKQPVDVTP
jgi:hypothetical protein